MKSIDWQKLGHKLEHLGSSGYSVEKTSAAMILLCLPI